LAAEAPEGRGLVAASLAALGIVYGDIGTSPLYALRECFSREHGIPPSPDNVLGVVSLIFWSLILVISVKYLALVLRAENRGEGGILVLMCLVRPDDRPREFSRWLLVALGLFGAALLYGDGMITPAISVLSAVEGLGVATPLFRPAIVPITIAILVGLFLFQQSGTGRIGALFGPVTLIWFAALAALGVAGILREPAVLAALDPLRGVRFFVANRGDAFLVLGAIFLVVTGGEALYADMGHFGPRPIRFGWFVLVLPALVLNYMGQGALLLAEPAAADNPFYRLVPVWGLVPMVGLATAATIIASQAVISGAFSLTRQAVHFGYSPRLAIEHTSPSEIGQIYIPGINWILMVAAIGLVLGFGSSGDLASAYGVAVSTTMAITTVLFYVVARERWHWRRWFLVPLAAFFLVIDLAFFASNIVKVPQGGWFPLVVAALVFTLMTTWRRGRQILAQRVRTTGFPIETFLANLPNEKVERVPGTAIFLTGNPAGTPPALLHNLKHNRVLHERVVLLHVTTEDVPTVLPVERVEIEELGQGFYSMVARYGFMESPDIPRVLERAAQMGLPCELLETSFFLSSETLIATQEKPGMAVWRERLFALLARNAQRATAYFRLPPNRVIELGTQIEL